MQVDILTIFPEFFESPLKVSLLGKAIEEKKLKVVLHHLRDFTTDKHAKVDDIPYGGGAGMVFKAEPIVRAVQAIPKKKRPRSLLFSPRGRVFTQTIAREWMASDQLILICSRYEGVDERARELVVDEEVSIGDYILNGGEAAALVILETLVRLIPGVLGNEASLHEESFAEGLLEYPQYTRPSEFQGLTVPEVLRTGHHREISQWRRKKALETTFERRPDLLKKAKLTPLDQTFLKGLQKKQK